MSESQADDCLKRGQEISVAGEQNESVILPAEGQVHQVHSDGHVNALFLGRLAGPAAVVELSADDLDPVSRVHRDACASLEAVTTG
jgi:hypothetical protein